MYLPPFPARHRKTRVDEVGSVAEHDGGSGNGDGPEQGGVDEVARGLLAGVAELPFVPELPQIARALPPQPGTATLLPLSGLQNLRACLIPNQEPEPVAEEAEIPARELWRLEDSAFALKVSAVQ